METYGTPPTRPRGLIVSDAPAPACCLLRETVSSQPELEWVFVLLVTDGRAGQGLLMEVAAVLRRQADAQARELAGCLGIGEAWAASAAELCERVRPGEFRKVLVVTDDGVPAWSLDWGVPLTLVPHGSAA